VLIWQGRNQDVLSRPDHSFLCPPLTEIMFNEVFLDCRFHSLPLIRSPPEECFKIPIRYSDASQSVA